MLRGQEKGQREEGSERKRDPYLAVHELELVSDLLPLSVGPRHQKIDNGGFVGTYTTQEHVQMYTHTDHTTNNIMIA